ncbi:MAG: large-conductance mechanosensitive channel protein MscL [Clostridium sp.]|nr:large-conductance mechanosensitive channel protein MscL [Clostridium sp.]MDU7083581.1 large-conductance mechanosensitive channel protein MscL [Clostridium sp.]
MKKFISEFKSFALKGNIFDLAIGVVIGGAFNKIVSSLVTDIIMPIVGFLTGGINFTEYKITLVEAIGDKAAVTLNIGLFIQNVVDFLIIALSIFVTIKVIAKLEKRVKKEQKAEGKKTPEEVILLKEIRDLLKENNQGLTKEEMLQKENEEVVDMPQEGNLTYE